MAFTIKGKIRITDRTNSGVDFRNLRVRAYDYDPNSDNDFMGMDTVANGGTFSIHVDKTKWDKAFKKNRRKPDVFIIVEYYGKGKTPKANGYWVSLYRSRIYRNHATDLVINPKITIRSETHSTCFSPSQHGWNFVNSFDKKYFFNQITVGLGFCGGMVFSAFDRYNKNQAIPAQKTPPKDGERLFKHLYNRQLTSFNSGGVIARVLNWINKADEAHAHRGHSVGYLTKKEMKKIKEQVKAGKPVPIVLVRHEGITNTFKAGDSHQVLVYKYTEESTLNRVRFWVYDPNYPNRDDIVLTIYKGYAENRIRIIHSAQSTLRERGFFINNAYNKDIKICKR